MKQVRFLFIKKTIFRTAVVLYTKSNMNEYEHISVLLATENGEHFTCSIIWAMTALSKKKRLFFLQLMVRKPVNFNRPNIFIDIFGYKMYIYYLRM